LEELFKLGASTLQHRDRVSLHVVEGGTARVEWEVADASCLNCLGDVLIEVALGADPAGQKRRFRVPGRSGRGEFQLDRTASLLVARLCSVDPTSGHLHVLATCASGGAPSR